MRPSRWRRAATAAAAVATVAAVSVASRAGKTATQRRQRSEPGSRSGLFAFWLEFFQTADGFLAQPRRLASDVGLTQLFDTGEAAVERRDQLVELTREIVRAHRHRGPPLRRLSRREAFQI